MPSGPVFVTLLSFFINSTYIECCIITNLFQNYKTYRMFQKFRDHGPNLFKELSLAEGKRLKNPSGVECRMNEAAY